MCGLAGLFNYGRSFVEPPDENLGLRMIDALSHRGPDDGGLLVTPRLMLGLRRLAILDLSSDGHQPMTDDEEECWIAFNGEIYNFRELRCELQAAGHRFKSQTDTEVILRGYRQWGDRVVERLNGMFAFALWDRRDDSLWLVRDSVGIKPLFYHDDGRTLRFGSEIKAILADGSIERRADFRGLDHFLTFGYTPAPFTGFDGIQQLRPGEGLRVHQGQLTKSRWGRLPYPTAAPRATIDECTDRLEAAIDAAVKRQMVSDVPLGALLSGGLDSTAVVRAMRRSGVREIDTFTIGFLDESFDESPYAARVAARYDTRHHRQIMAADIADLLRTVVSHAEEPFSDNSMIPFYLLSEHTRNHVTVALSGDGADELLAGYSTYRASQWAPYYRRLPASWRSGIIEPLVRRLPDSTKKYGLPSLLNRFVAAAARPFPWDHCSWRRIVFPALRSMLYTPAFLAAASDDPLAAYAETLDDVPDWATDLEKQLHLDLRFHLPNDMLVKVDRMSMAHSLEVRVPLLDQQVIAACLAMPSDCKRRGSRGKLPLRRLLQRDLPQDLVQRKKAGFLVPIESWLRGPWRPLLEQFLTEDFAQSTGLFQWKTLKTMLDSQAKGVGDYSYPLFSLLVLAIWWETWMTQAAPTRCRKRSFVPTQVHRRNEWGGAQ